MVHASGTSHPFVAPRWLRTGGDAYRRMIELIGEARHSVRLETYIYRADEIGNRFLGALEAASRRGVQVRVLVDGFGSASLPRNYWQQLKQAGAEVRVFNPLTWSAFSFRNHRKLFVVDDVAAIVGGFNIAAEYDGDGVERGWRDLGVELCGLKQVQALAVSFDEMIRAYNLSHRLFQRMRHPLQRSLTAGRHEPVLLCGPHVGGTQFRKNLLQALSRAKRVQITSGYFMPDFRVRRALRQVARRGGVVDLILAGKSDVPLAQVAARGLYGQLLKAGVKIWEYEPQILHAKLAIVDGCVFVGSSNLDTRSFTINYELMVRLENATTLAEAQEIFATDQHRSLEITWQSWNERQNWFTRGRGFFARMLLTKIDPWLARWQLRALS